MPASTSPESYQRASSAVAVAFRGRSILGFHHNQVISTDQIGGEESRELDLFQCRVADSLCSLGDSQRGPIPSLLFLEELLDVFLSTGDGFKNLLSKSAGLAPKSSVDRLLSDLAGRWVKSLDLCNELTRDLRSAHRWNLHASIAAVASGNGQLIRAEKALRKLFTATVEGGGGAERARAGSRNSRPLPRSWSAGKHLQGMSPSLVPPPRGAGGLEAAVYTMSAVTSLAMYALAAAFSPVTGGGGGTNPMGAARRMAWGPAAIGMRERIGEEARKRGKKGGVLAEVLEVERTGRGLLEGFEGGGAGNEVAKRAKELGEASGRLDEGLGVLERKIREVFHGIVRSRGEVMRCLEREDD